MPRNTIAVALALVLLSLASCGTASDVLHVAVATNFAEPAREIADRFTNVTGESVSLSFGSTGQLFAQISQGAPFEVFLAADQETPARVVTEGWGLAESVFTYATGDIVLYGPDLDLTDGEAVLRIGQFERIAVANPRTAPYGRAAIEVIAALGLDGSLAPRIVEGNNIAQAFQFVESGNAELGFVAGSQVGSAVPSSVWRVPSALYSPIRQDAVVLTRSAESTAARAFVDFLRGPEALEIVRDFGYQTGV